MSLVRNSAGEMAASLSTCREEAGVSHFKVSSLNTRIRILLSSSQSSTDLVSPGPSKYFALNEHRERDDPPVFMYSREASGISIFREVGGGEGDGF